jgi:hypothetical protein
MDTVTFHGIEYKLRQVELPEFGSVLVSTTRLNDALMHDGCAYVSDAARRIDEKIFYFVEESEIHLSGTILSHRILKELA